LPQRPAMERSSLDAFLEKARLAKAEFVELANKFEALSREVASDKHAVSRPDSTYRLEALATQMRAAVRNYQLAMEEHERALKRP
jgi:hypothetical protein